MINKLEVSKTFLTKSAMPALIIVFIFLIIISFIITTNNNQNKQAVAPGTQPENISSYNSNYISKTAGIFINDVFTYNVKNFSDYLSDSYLSNKVDPSLISQTRTKATLLYGNNYAVSSVVIKSSVPSIDHRTPSEIVIAEVQVNIIYTDTIGNKTNNLKTYIVTFTKKNNNNWQIIGYQEKL